MRGHEQLIDVRRRRYVPKTVQIWAGTDALKGWADWNGNSAHAEVEIQDSEPLSSLDLRFCVGLVVFVTGTDPFRVAAIHAGCLAAGAARVLSAAVYFDKPGSEGVTGRINDSAGTCTC